MYTLKLTLFALAIAMGTLSAQNCPPKAYFYQVADDARGQINVLGFIYDATDATQCPDFTNSQVDFDGYTFQLAKSIFNPFHQQCIFEYEFIEGLPFLFPFPKTITWTGDVAGTCEYAADMTFSGNGILTSLSSVPLIAELPLATWSESDQFQLFPNPATSSFRYRLKAESPIQRIKLYNQLGQLIQDVPSTTEVVNIEHLNSGIYTVTIETTEQHYIQRLIKQ